MCRTSNSLPTSASMKGCAPEWKDALPKLSKPLKWVAALIQVSPTRSTFLRVTLPPRGCCARSVHGAWCNSVRQHRSGRIEQMRGRRIEQHRNRLAAVPSTHAFVLDDQVLAQAHIDVQQRLAA